MLTVWCLQEVGSAKLASRLAISRAAPVTAPQWRRRTGTWGPFIHAPRRQLACVSHVRRWPSRTLFFVILYDLILHKFNATVKWLLFCQVQGEELPQQRAHDCELRDGVCVASFHDKFGLLSLVFSHMPSTSLDFHFHRTPANQSLSSSMRRWWRRAARPTQSRFSHTTKATSHGTRPSAPRWKVRLLLLLFHSIIWLNTYLL